MNGKKHTSKSSQGSQYTREAKKEFTRVLRAAKPHLRIFACDRKNHTARALLSGNGGAHIANLSLATDDEGRRHLHLVVILQRPSPMPTSQQEAFLRFQSHMNIGMTSVIYDGEHLSFQVRAQSLLLCSHLLEFVIIMIVTATRRILEDDNFNQFLN